MSKKDMTGAQNELRKGQEETAATAAVHQRRTANAPNSSAQKGWVGKAITALAVFIGIAALVGAIWLFLGNIKKEETTITVNEIRELATLATAEAHVTVTKEVQDNKLFGNDIPFNLPIPGTKRDMLLLIPAKVIAGVDLKSLAEDDFKVDTDTKEGSITLPRAKLIHEPAILMADVKTFSDEGLLSGDIKWDEGFDLAAAAQEDIKKEVEKLKLLETAEQSAEKMLTSFLSNLGYSVSIKFK